MSPVKDKSPLSVAVIAKNEEQNLPACLESVRFAEQVVVVDSGSTDSTAQIARSFGCEVYDEPWRGFAAQKQFAIDRCTRPWILLLDADERVSPEAESAIRGIVASGPGDAAGYSFPRKNFFQGRWIKHLWGNDRVVRLFRKGAGRMTDARVHEAVEVNGPLKALEAPLEHYTESSLSRLLVKMDHYTTLGAQEAFAEGKRASVGTAVLMAFLAFLQSYLLKRGFLDGVQGLTLSAVESVSKFYKYAKLSELSGKGGGGTQERP